MAHYYDHPAGVEAPSVTTILGAVAAEALYNWKLENALKLIRDNKVDLTVPKSLKGAILWAEEQASIDAELGTWLHKLAENRLLSNKSAIVYPKVPDILQGHEETMEIMASNLETFLSAIKPYGTIACEYTVHGDLDGVNDNIGYYSGTIDAVLEYGGRIILLDFKTSYGTYDNHLAQVAAYGYAWNNDRVNNKPRVKALCVIRIGKTKDAAPYHSEYCSGKKARLSLSLFQTAMNLWYIRSGRWGDILTKE